MRGSDFLDIDRLETKEDFIRLLFGILGPLKDRYDSFCSGLDTGRVFAHYDAKAADMEAFSRPLWGLVPLWAGGENDGPWEGISREFAGIYTQQGRMLYVSMGVGGRIPFRLGAWPEINLLTLRNKLS